MLPRKVNIQDLHVWEYHPHASSIEHLLHEPDTTLIRHPNEGGEATEKPCTRDRAGICKGESRMLKINEKGVKAGVLG